MRTASLIRFIAAACTLLLGTTLAPGAQEKFPSRPITVIVPTAPGGGTDIATRFLASEAEQTLGQKILVVNKPGAGGAIGVENMLQAKPDGYTLTGVWNSPVTITPQMFKVTYTMSNLVPIVLSDITPVVYCVDKSFPANDGKQFIALLKNNPNKYTYGTDGVSGIVHFAGEVVFGALGVQARAIPYGGAGQTLEAFLGHSVDIYGGSIPPILPFVKKGTAKCLLVTSARRNAALPDASSLSDLGIPKDDTELWHGIVAPAGVPKDRIAILEHAFQEAARSPKYQAFAQKQGEDAVAYGSDVTQKLFEQEYSAFGRVIATLGLAKTK